MNIVFSKHIIKINFIILSLFVLTNCQLKSPNKTHGINYLENREKALFLDKSNKNDVIKIIGSPHTVSIDDKDEWIYFERILTKGEFHKLGQNVLKENNILFLKFNKFGIVENKRLIGKDSKNKLTFSKNETDNTLTKKSFIQKFLSSLRNKMYSNKK